MDGIISIANQINAVKADSRVAGSHREKLRRFKGNGIAVQLGYPFHRPPRKQQPGIFYAAGLIGFMLLTRHPKMACSNVSDE
jgi:hypothetical protein